MNGGLTKPFMISEELATFLSWDPSVPRCRNDVTKAIYKYVRDHNLQDPVHRRNIIPDKKLAKLLRFDVKKDTLSHPLIQRFINPHYLK